MALSLRERIGLVKQISQKLGEEEWGIIDLSLSQLNLPTTDSWSGNKDQYIVQMLRDAPEFALTELADLVGLSAQLDPEPIHPKFWIGSDFRIFISHLATQRAYAGQLQDAFSAYGISSFVAHKDIEPALEWQNEIELALRSCDALVALMHPGFHASNWTDQEIGFVMGRSKPTFAVILGEAPYGFIGRFQAFNGSNKPVASVALEIFTALLNNKETSASIAFCLAKSLESSGSFARSVQLVALLEKVQHADQRFAQALHSSLKNNSQVYKEGLHSVPERVEALIKKHSKT
jgi:hypothetical protein